MNTLSYGNHSVAIDKLPAASVSALMQRGFNHIMANETASYVSGKIEKALALPDKTAKDARTAAFKQYRLANAEQVLGWEREARDESVAEMLAGTIGTSSRGPKVDPLTAAMQAIAKDEIITICKTNNVKISKGIATFAGGATKTLDAMIEKRLADHAERIKKEGERKVAEDSRKAKKAQEDAAKRGAVPATVEDLGL